jgi:hypothetical protein
VVYARKLGNQTYTFQVSGRLWRNSLIMVDRESETFWSQITGRAIDGKHHGSQLRKLESVQATWEQWRSGHADTTVLKKSAEVQGSHYQGYFDDPEKMGLFRSQWLAERMPGKTLVYGAAVGPHALAVTDGALENGLVDGSLGETPVVVSRGRDGGVRGFVAEVEGEKIELRRLPGSELIRDGGGSTWDLDAGRCVAGPRAGARLEPVAVTPVYWFAWSSFYPNTQVID